MKKRRDAPHRRTLPAGHVILVVVIGLGAATLLNAQALERTAETQLEEGSWRQDVALAFARPLSSISSFLHIDVPRGELDEALGKRQGPGFSGADPADLPDPTTSTAAGSGSATSTTLAPPTPVTPQDPLRVWIAGDSLSGEYGKVLSRRLNDTGVMETNRSGEVIVSSGLARPDFFDWFGFTSAATNEFGADVVVLTFGLNDDQNMKLADGTSVVFGTPEWDDEYRRRVGGLMDQQIAEGRTVVWVGIPPIRDRGRSERYAHINAIFEEQANLRPEVIFIDTWDVVTNEKGEYADIIGDGSGGSVRVRTPDGVHLETGGARFVTDQTMKQLAEHFDWTSWETAPSTTAPTSTAPTTTEPPELREARHRNP